MSVQTQSALDRGIKKRRLDFGWEIAPLLTGYFSYSDNFIFFVC